MAGTLIFFLFCVLSGYPAVDQVVRGVVAAALGRAAGLHLDWRPRVLGDALLPSLLVGHAGARSEVPLHSSAVLACLGIDHGWYLLGLGRGALDG